MLEKVARFGVDYFKMLMLRCSSKAVPGGIDCPLCKHGLVSVGRSGPEKI